ncbi:MAG: 4Fe-4S dicluster domain-containing protein [Planctomycetes bacterium]|nr:4Fe-4S dicluster domain-containing protein [Planctomycetota bacterium]
MPQVPNWQIGRAMEYPYAAAYPRRQFAFVININRCIACQTCTMACKSTWTFSKGQEHMWWTNVETKPYGGYPQGWDVKLLQLLEQANPGGQTWSSAGRFEGETIFEAAHGAAPQADGAAAPGRVLGYLPADDEWASPNIHEDSATSTGSGVGGYEPGGVSLPEHRTWFFYLARLCNHCSYPACLAACPRKAIYKREEDGVVLIDQARCRGYRKCVEACPYKKPMYRPTTRVSEQCIACSPRLEGKDPETGGRPMETRCMAACIGQVRMQGLVQVGPDGDWAEDPRHPLYYLVKVARVALPLYPQLGTQPNGYYIPPRWVPRPYLEQMFGPGVGQAIERYTVPDRELLAVLQLFRRDNRVIYSYKIEEGPKVYETEVHGRPFTLYDDTVIAYGRDGEELFRTKVEEPFYVRPEKHPGSI